MAGTPPRLSFCMGADRAAGLGIYNARLPGPPPQASSPHLAGVLAPDQEGGRVAAGQDRQHRRPADRRARLPVPRPGQALGPPRAVAQQLALLSAARQRLLAVHNRLAGPLAERQGFVSPTFQKQLRKGCQASLAATGKDRKAREPAPRRRTGPQAS